MCARSGKAEWAPRYLYRFHFLMNWFTQILVRRVERNAPFEMTALTFH